MRKFVKGLAVAAVGVMVAVGAPSYNGAATVVTADAAAKVLSIDKAAKKIVDANYKAYYEGKKVPVNVTIKCPCKKDTYVGRDKAANKVLIKLDAAVDKWAYGDMWDRIPEKVKVDDARYDAYYYYAYNWIPSSGERVDNNPYLKYKNGKLTIKFVAGEQRWFKENVENVIYGIQNLEELFKLTEGLEGLQKARRIAEWMLVDKELKYGGALNYGDAAFAKKEAVVQCANAASCFRKYAMAMGLNATVMEASKIHECSCFEYKGVLYMLDVTPLKENLEFDNREGLLDRYQFVLNHIVSLEEEFTYREKEYANYTYRELVAEKGWDFHDLNKYIPDGIPPFIDIDTLDWDIPDLEDIYEDEYDGYDPNAVAVPEPSVPSAESQPEDSEPTLNEDGLDDSFLDDWDWENLEVIG